MNMKKTVLKLEEEMNTISNNLSKIKKKDNITMKKIVHNINYLLTKCSPRNNTINNINPKDLEYIDHLEEKKIMEKNQENRYNNYINTNDKTLDYILILLTGSKNNNINSLRKDENQYNNKKSFSSSKIYNYNPISEGKSINYDKTLYNNVEYSNSNDIVDYSNNQILNKSNKIAYSKPKLMNNYSKRTTKNNKIISTNNENNFHYHNYMSIQNEIKENKLITNLKYLTINNNNMNNINQANKENINNNRKDIVNNDYYNYQNKTGNNFINENKYESTYSYRESDLKEKKPHINEEEKINKEDCKQETDNDNDNDIISSITKNKTLIFKRKLIRNNTSGLNSNSKIKNPFSLNRFNKKSIQKHKRQNLNLNNIGNSNKINHYLSIDDEDSNNNDLSNNYNNHEKYMFSFENENNKDRYIDDNILHQGNSSFKKKYRKHKSYNNVKKIYYGFNNKENVIDNHNTNIIENNNNIDINKINILLKIINVNNINDAINKLNNLVKYEQYINKLKELYDENNNNSYNEKIENNNFIWLSNIINNYKKNELYKKYCKKIMVKNKLKKFEDFKEFINNILTKNKKNKGFIVEVKNLLCEDDYYSKNQNININKINYEPIKKKKPENNKIINNSINSNDIKFTQNDENLKLITESNNTCY